VPLVPDDKADGSNGDRTRYDARIATDPDVAAYRITGAFFFGGALNIGTILDRIADRHQAFVIDFAAVPFIDSTAANTIASVARKASRSGVSLLISGASSAVRRSLLSHGLRPPGVTYARTIDDGIAAAHQMVMARNQVSNLSSS